jgi:alpha-1,3-rhamnosyltransferase
MNIDLPLVSVIISCYNHQDFIQSCIESVIRQTYPNIELIVFDDGSSDRSPVILDALSKQHGFYFKAQENAGLSTTLNRALAEAKGEYICQLGSDDILMLDKVEKQVNYMEQHPDIALLGGNILCIDDAGVIKAQQKLTPYREVDFNTLMLNPKQGPPAPTMMMQADVLRGIGGYNPNNNLEDLYLWLKFTHSGHKVAILNDVLAYYRKHSYNTTKNYRFMTESILDIFQEYKEEPCHAQACNKILISMFLKVSKKDRRYAWKLLKRIDPRFYNLKVLRGLIYWLLPDV